MTQRCIIRPKSEFCCKPENAQWYTASAEPIGAERTFALLQHPTKDYTSFCFSPSCLLIPSTYMHTTLIHTTTITVNWNAPYTILHVILSCVGWCQNIIPVLFNNDNYWLIGWLIWSIPERCKSGGPNTLHPWQNVWMADIAIQCKMISLQISQSFDPGRNTQLMHKWFVNMTILAAYRTIINYKRLCFSLASHPIA